MTNTHLSTYSYRKKSILQSFRVYISESFSVFLRSRKTFNTPFAKVEPLEIWPWAFAKVSIRESFYNETFYLQSRTLSQHYESYLLCYFCVGANPYSTPLRWEAMVPSLRNMPSQNLIIANRSDLLHNW